MKYQLEPNHIIDNENYEFIVSIVQWVYSSDLPIIPEKKIMVAKLESIRDTFLLDRDPIFYSVEIEVRDTVYHISGKRTRKVFIGVGKKTEDLEKEYIFGEYYQCHSAFDCHSFLVPYLKERIVSAEYLVE